VFCFRAIVITKSRFEFCRKSLKEKPDFCHKQIRHGVLVVEQRRRAGDGSIKASKVTVPGLKNVPNPR
jgi:hypothetical protein